MPWTFMAIGVGGSVAPCGYWAYSQGHSLGDTNSQTIDEIWNGSGYQELRSRHVSGNLEGHPCGACMAFRHCTPGHYPQFELGDVHRNGGLCYTVKIADRFWEYHRTSTDDMTLFEDGIPLPDPNSLHEDIRRLGKGRYSVWKGYVYFSTIDCSNPALNGRKYELRCGEDVTLLTDLDTRCASGKNIQLAHEEYCNGAIFLTARPSTLMYVGTTDCNIDCPACNQNEMRRTGIEHRPETTSDVLAHVRYLSEFIWQGGEPYMMPRFRRFVDEFDSKVNPNLSFSFMSNGTMLNRAELKKLEKFERFNVIISIDSFNKENFEKLRAGAKFERVIESFERLLTVQDWPKRKVSVAMAVGKSNVREIRDSMAYALQHGFRLTVQPIMVYPATEQMNCFSNFPQQTEGWDAALAGAQELLARMATSDDQQGFCATHALGMFGEIREIYERAKAENIEAVELTITIDDPDQSIRRMRRPGFLIVPIFQMPDAAVAYGEIAADAGTCTIYLPKARFDGPLRYALYADLHDFGSIQVGAQGVIDLSNEPAIEVFVVVPPYTPTVRLKNIHYVKQTGQFKDESAAPVAQWLGVNEGNDFISFNERTANARRVWPMFLINHLKPFFRQRA